MKKGAIFDMDGTILDSMPTWRGFTKVIIELLGMEQDPELEQTLGVLGVTKGADYLNEHYGMNITPEQIQEQVNDKIINLYKEEFQPKEGVLEFIEACRAHGFRMCVASATDSPYVEMALKRLGIRDCFLEVFSCSQVGKGKDEPDIYEAALACLGLEKEEVIVLEDSHHAAVTAKNAGFPVVGIYDVMEPRTEELKALADYYTVDYKNLAGIFKE